MNSIFTELDIGHMEVATGALREGVLYDLIGRFHKHDMREATVREFMRRYHVDPPQAGRVQELASALLGQIIHKLTGSVDNPHLLVAWAARLHEIGISIAHAGYHRHSAYILANADMPGFSTREQAQVSLLVRAHRGALSKLTDMVQNTDQWTLILVLRLASLLCRSRSDAELPPMKLKLANNAYSLTLDRAWLERNPLTKTLLEDEGKAWKSIGMALSIKTDKDL